MTTAAFAAPLHLVATTESLGGLIFGWHFFTSLPVMIRLHGGEPVVVKVQRPEIGELVDRDLQVLRELARGISWQPRGARPPGAHRDGSPPATPAPHLDRLATIAERDGLKARISLFTDAQDVSVLTRRVNRVVMAFLGGVVGLISVLLIGVSGGPPFTGDTSLYEFFGYFGLYLLDRARATGPGGHHP